MKPPFGQLPQAQPRFRRPALSAGRRQFGRSLVHMTFLLLWFGIMIVCTPLGGWILNFGEQLTPPDPPRVTRQQVQERLHPHYKEKRAAALQLFQQKKYQEAAFEFKQLQDPRLNDPEITIKQIRCYLELGMYDYVKTNYGNNNMSKQYLYKATTGTLEDLQKADPTPANWKKAGQVAQVAGSLSGLREIAQAYLDRKPGPALQAELEQYLRSYRY